MLNIRVSMILRHNQFCFTYKSPFVVNPKAEKWRVDTRIVQTLVVNPKRQRHSQTKPHKNWTEAQTYCFQTQIQKKEAHTQFDTKIKAMLHM